MCCGQVLITFTEILRIRREHNLLHCGNCYISLCSFFAEFSHDVTIPLPFCCVCVFLIRVFSFLLLEHLSAWKPSLALCHWVSVGEQCCRAAGSMQVRVGAADQLSHPCYRYHPSTGVPVTIQSMNTVYSYISYKYRFLLCFCAYKHFVYFE